MVERDIDFKVFRYKQGGAAPAYQTFRVRCDENTTVLVALQDIRPDQDGTLIMRHSCHHASCGTCGMRINGREELGCVVKVFDLNTSTVCLLYTSDAADERSSVDLGGRRIIKKKKIAEHADVQQNKKKAVNKQIKNIK